jgi:hypothetical protein
MILILIPLNYEYYVNLELQEYSRTQNANNKISDLGKLQVRPLPVSVFVGG